MKQATQKLLKQVSLKILIVAVLFLTSLFIFSFIASEAVYEHEDDFDRRVIVFISSHTSQELIKVITVFTFFGSSQFLLPAYIILIGYYFFRKNFRFAIDISVIAVSSFLLMLGLKQIFHRQRPDMPIIKGITTFSFPSGHALSSFIFCSVLAWLVWKGDLKKVWKWALTVLLLLFSLTVGLSRIILNVHYTTDVIAGFCLGIMWVILSFWLLRKFQPNNTPALQDQL